MVFDTGAIADRAGMEEPKVYPYGIEHVVVNGSIMVEEGHYRREEMPDRLLTG